MSSKRRGGPLGLLCGRRPGGGSARGAGGGWGELDDRVRERAGFGSARAYNIYIFFEAALDGATTLHILGPAVPPKHNGTITRTLVPLLRHMP